MVVPAVRAFVDEKGFRQDLYIVTGIKTAFSVRCGEDIDVIEKKNGVNAPLELDAALLGVHELKARPDIAHGSADASQIFFEAAFYSSSRAD